MNREDNHKRLSQIVKQAYDENDETKFVVPEPDLDFLDEAPLKEKKKRVRSVSRVAAAVICVIALGSGLTIWFNSEGAYGGKTILNNIRQNFNSGQVVTKTGEETGDDAEWETSTTITSEKDFDSAKRFIPTLYLPTYMPEGFTFEKMEMTKTSEDTYTTSAMYRKGKQWVMIGAIHSGDDDTEYGAESDGSPPIELKDRKIYTGYDELEDIYDVSVFFDDQLVGISGNIEPEELIKIAKGLEL